MMSSYPPSGRRVATRRTPVRQTLLLISMLVVVFAVGAFAVSCSGSTATTTGDTPGTSAGGGADGTQVIMKDLAFDPATVTIRAGESVTWVNQDSMGHTVVADNGEFESSALSGGATFSFTFDTAGTYAYHCGIHPSMIAEVIVQ